MASGVIIDGTFVPLIRGGSDEGDLGGGDAPVADAGADLGGALDSATDRINATLDAAGDLGDDGDLDGDGDPDPAAPAAPAGEPAVGADDGSMTYRDAQRLRAEQKAYRERFQPYEQALAGLPDETQAFARQTLPLVVRGNADVAAVIGEYANLHPDDRAIVDEVAASIAVNPEAAAADFARIAEALRAPADDEIGGGDDVDDDLEPDLADDLDDDDGPDYLTADDLDSRLGEWFQRAQMTMAEQQETLTVLAEVKELGYDLESSDDYEQARVESLFALARRKGGDLQEAHRILTGQREAAVNEFVGGKAADAGRPQPPLGGAPPSSERQLETDRDAEASMRSRLDSAFGPSR